MHPPKEQTIATEADAAEFDRANLPLVKTLVAALVKYIAGRKLYAANNPTLKRFNEELKQALQAFFERQDELVLFVEEYSLKWSGETVYHNDKREDSIAFVLYRDGIGEVTIRRDVTDEELDGFVDLIRDVLSGAGGDEDVVTGFWRADFVHVLYRVLDEYLTGEFGEGKPQSAEDPPLELNDHPELPSFADTGRVLVSSSDPPESLAAYIRQMALARSTSDSPEELEHCTQATLDAFFRVSSEELRLCQQEILREHQSDALIDFVGEILDFLLLKDNPSAVRDVSNIVECVIEHTIAESNPSTMATLLDIMTRFHSGLDRSEPPLDNVTRLLGSLCTKEVLETVAAGVDIWSPASEARLAYLHMVGAPAANMLCDMLHRVKGVKLHQAICDIIADIVPERIPAMVEELNVDDPRLAQDVVLLMSRVDVEGVPPVIRQLVHYPDHRVRDEAIQFLAHKGGEDAVQTLVALLDDDDKHARVKAMSALERVDHDGVVQRVRELIDIKDALERDGEEQEQLYRLFGAKCGADALPHIREILDKKKLFGLAKDKNSADRINALRALEQIDGEESLQLLERLANDGDGLVKSRAQRIVATRQKTAVEGEHL